jgi:hypothetical protein
MERRGVLASRQQERGQPVVSGGSDSVAAYYSRPWSIRDAAGDERPALLRVQLGELGRAEIDRLIDEFERERPLPAGDALDDVTAWLAQQGISAEIVPVAPGMF